MSGKRAATTGRRVLIAVAIATLAIGGVIVASVPRGEQEQAVSAETTPGAVVHVTIVVETIDAKSGTMRVRVIAEAIASSDVPSEGISVLADIEGLAPLRVQSDSLTVAEGEGDIRFDRGSVGAYPFDRYDGTIGLLAVTGAPDTLADALGSDAIPMSVTVIESTTGFDLEATPDEQAGDLVSLVLLSYTATRTAPVVVWACTMMAIYWLLTAAVVAVVLVTVLGFREWETRHLAWLAAMIFAFTSFRAAAPDSPPIGVYFDFASFFWAELIVAVCLATMVVKYLIGRGLAGVEIPAADEAGEAEVAWDAGDAGNDGDERAATAAVDPAGTTPDRR